MSWSVLGVKELNTLQSKFRYHLCLENWWDIFRSNCLSSSTYSTIKFFFIFQSVVIFHWAQKTVACLMCLSLHPLSTMLIMPPTKAD